MTVLVSTLQILSDLLPNNDLIMWLGTFLPIFIVGYPVGYLMMKNLPTSDFEDNKLNFKSFIVYFCICYTFMYFGNIIGNLLSSVLSNGDASNPLNNYIMSDANIFIRIAIFVVLSPLCEELIFRKVIIDRTVRFGQKTAIAFSAVMFALFHLNLYQIFYAFGIGLVFGHVYVKTHDIKYSFMLHALLNFMGSILSTLVLSTLDMELLNEIAEAGYVVTIDENTISKLFPGALILLIWIIFIFALSIAGFVLFVKNIRKVKYPDMPEQLEKGTVFNTVYLNVGVIVFICLCASVMIYITAIAV